jgi:ornithine cyclodeaminase/alanine dehydrogenase-like protein (mu-crystallin family)
MIPDMLVIVRGDIRRIMSQADWLSAARLAFHAAAAGKANAPPPLHLPVAHGGFHAKGASLSLDRQYVAVKVNGNFPANPAEFGLPTIQGVIVLADGNNGVLLAILDSIEVTLRRTAAASALAAQLLAAPKSSTLLVCGCGEQGRAHAEALRYVLPIERVLLWDRDREAAELLARAINGEPVDDFDAASLTADIIACCTSAREPFLNAGIVRGGTFIAAVGADNPDKNEIAPSLMASAAIVTDSTAQCAAMGDLHHALAAGLIAQNAVRAELGEVVTRSKVGRRSPDEIIIFDSTGTGLQDVAAAATIYERLSAAGTAQVISLAREALR